MYMCSHSTSLQPGVYNHLNGYWLTFSEKPANLPGGGGGGRVTSHLGYSNNTSSHFILPEVSKNSASRQPPKNSPLLHVFGWLLSLDIPLFL